ncbi:MAG: cytochrome PufQ [Pseudomonadota bacterium]
MANISFEQSPEARRGRQGGLEYSLYFALIFTISLLPALVRMAVPKRGEKRRFFVTHARQMAREVTPMIFSV